MCESRAPFSLLFLLTEEVVFVSCSNNVSTAHKNNKQRVHKKLQAKRNQTENMTSQKAHQIQMCANVPDKALQGDNLLEAGLFHGGDALLDLLHAGRKRTQPAIDNSTISYQQLAAFFSKQIGLLKEISIYDLATLVALQY